MLINLKNSIQKLARPNVIWNCYKIASFSTTAKYENDLENGRKIIKSENYDLAPVRPEDHRNVMQFLQENFFVDEPLTQRLHLVGCNIEPQLYKLIEGFVRQGLSMKAVDKSSQKNLLGVSINIKSSSSDADKIKNASKTCISLNSSLLMNTWYLMFSQPDLHKYYNDDDIFAITLGAINRDIRNHGLGKALVTTSISHAKSLNYETVSMFCTNKYMSIIAKQLDMRLRWEFPFRDIVKKDIECTFPHTHVQVYAKRIKNCK